MSSPLIQLFTPVAIGSLKLKNRIVMGPLTRNRAVGKAPAAHNVKYYSQRASAGLIISEGTQVEPEGAEWSFAPGIYNDEQVAAWKQVTDAVHADGGLIVMQLWHVGRVAHPLLQSGAPTEGPSAIAARGGKFRLLDGHPGYVTPRAMTNPRRLLQVHRHAAENAKRAGFDGVELHAANGFTMHQFLDASSNQRNDEFGGSAENRSRLPLEVVRELIDVFGADRVGVRISPSGGYNDMGFDKAETIATYGYFLEQLSQLKVAFVFYFLHTPELFDVARRGTPIDHVELKKRFTHGKWILSGGLDGESGEAALNNGEADAIAYGRYFICNPDVVYRLRHNLPLPLPDPADYYWDMKAPIERGYTDHPFADVNPEAHQHQQHPQ